MFPLLLAHLQWGQLLGNFGIGQMRSRSSASRARQAWKGWGFDRRHSMNRMAVLELLELLVQQGVVS